MKNWCKGRYAQPPYPAYRERRQHEVVKYVLNCPVEDTFYNPDNIPLSEIRHPIYWMMPGSDHKRPKMKGCGPMRVKGSSGDCGLSYVACSNDPEHFIKGIDFHCWMYDNHFFTVRPMLHP